MLVIFSTMAHASTRLWLSLARGSQLGTCRATSTDTCLDLFSSGHMQGHIHRRLSWSILTWAHADPHPHTLVMIWVEDTNNSWQKHLTYYNTVLMCARQSRTVDRLGGMWAETSCLGTLQVYIWLIEKHQWDSPAKKHIAITYWLGEACINSQDSLCTWRGKTTLKIL